MPIEDLESRLQGGLTLPAFMRIQVPIPLTGPRRQQAGQSQTLVLKWLERKTLPSFVPEYRFLAITHSLHFWRELVRRKAALHGQRPTDGFELSQLEQIRPEHTASSQPELFSGDILGTLSVLPPPPKETLSHETIVQRLRARLRRDRMELPCHLRAEYEAVLWGRTLAYLGSAQCAAIQEGLLEDAEVQILLESTWKYVHNLWQTESRNWTRYQDAEKSQTHYWLTSVMKELAVPLILEELARQPSKLVWPLSHICHQEPPSGLDDVAAASAWFLECPRS